MKESMTLRIQSVKAPKGERGQVLVCTSVPSHVMHILEVVNGKVIAPGEVSTIEVMMDESGDGDFYYGGEVIEFERFTL